MTPRRRSAAAAMTAAVICAAGTTAAAADVLANPAYGVEMDGEQIRLVLCKVPAGPDAWRVRARLANDGERAARAAVVVRSKDAATVIDRWKSPRVAPTGRSAGRVVVPRGEGAFLEASISSGGDLMGRFMLLRRVRHC